MGGSKDGKSKVAEDECLNPIGVYGQTQVVIALRPLRLCVNLHESDQFESTKEIILRTFYTMY